MSKSYYYNDMPMFNDVTIHISILNEVQKQAADDRLKLLGSKNGPLYLKYQECGTLHDVIYFHT